MRIPGTPRTRAALVATASAALVLSPAAAHARAVDDTKLVPHTHFVMQADGSSGNTDKGAQIPNIDSVKATVRTYYNATGGVANKDFSPYITEMKGIEAEILKQLPNPAPAPHMAVVFDADDTTLWTYDMEDGAMHFNFNPTVQNDEWVQKAKFPATPGMVALVNEVAARGYDVYGITGRTNDQETATLANLSDLGYKPFNADNFYTKWTAQPGGTALPQPDYVNCAADSDPTKCSTVEYKAATRKHIQDSGETIVLNIGDQYSDLQGGYSMYTAKLPNPTYYLPSLDIAGAPAGDADLALPSEFDMAPDGSTPTTEGFKGGDYIPNIDVTRNTIRNYYGADPVTHKANKDTSPYISELAAFASKWAPKLRTQCANAVADGIKPAVVFDADDTTLWTYDMEDAAMGFNFDPVLQNKWVQDERFPAVPNMPRVVRAAAEGGCKIVGLTGRNSGQRTATLDNLAKYYYGKDDNSLFKSQYYFTKWNKDNGEEPPAYIDPTIDGKDGISTIDYKASTRKYVQDAMGLTIIANFGDQFSDLIGGSSATATKLPNPTYYLP